MSSLTALLQYVCKLTNLRKLLDQYQILIYNPRWCYTVNRSQRPVQC